MTVVFQHSDRVQMVGELRKYKTVGKKKKKTV